MKIEFISNIHVPYKKKYVRSFLGHVWYYRCFIKYFSKIVSPLYILLTQDAKFDWTCECQKAFLKLKDVLTKALVLRGPNRTLPFHICIDASDHVVGVILGQKEGNIKYVIYYIIKNLKSKYLNYIFIKKEMLVVFYAINKSRHYITGYQVFIHIDNATIRYLMNKLVFSGRLVRSLLLLQEFDINIIDKPRKANLVINFLSRLSHVGEESIIYYFFLDKHLFFLNTQSPWNENFINYLVTRKTPLHFSPREKNHLVEKILLSWISRFYSIKDFIML